MKELFRALGGLGRLAARIAIRPRLLVEAIRAGWAMRPLNGRLQSDYYRWRLYTAYGDPDERLREADVIEYLHWRERQRA